MSFIQPNSVDAGLEEVIDAVQARLLTVDPDTEEFSTIVKQLSKLHKIRSLKKSEGVKLETLLPVVGNLAGILLILNFERAHVVTSKALSFVLKSRM